MSVAAELVTTPSVDELKDTFRREHEATETAVASVLAHARAAGDALLAIRSRLAHGEWTPWVASDDCPAALNAVWTYMRIARFWDEVETSGTQTLKGATDLLRGRSFLRETGLKEIEREAKRLKDEGFTLREIGETLGCSKSTASVWVNPEKRKESRARLREAARRRHAADKALRDLEREHALRKALVNAGQAVNEAYKLATRLDGILGQARAEALTGEQRIVINEAHAARDKMMDAIIRALGIS